MSLTGLLNLERNKSTPGLPTLRRIAEEKGVNLQELVALAGGLKQEQEEDGANRLEPQKVRGVPILNRVKCSFDDLWSADDQGFLPGMADDFAPAPHGLRDPNAFALEADGESMADAGIQPGDLLVIAPNLAPESGDIVLALFKKEQVATVKRLRLIAGGKRALLISESRSEETREVELDGAVKIYLVYSWTRKTRARRRK
jgi:SOS-response transcriptional repressor LexA